MSAYAVGYTETVYASGRVAYSARLLLGDVPVLRTAEFATKDSALVGLAFRVIEQILDNPMSPTPGPADPCFVPPSRLPTGLRITVEDVLAHNFPKKTQAKVIARIRRREAQAAKETTR